MKILVIEDEAPLRRTLERALREEDFLVESAGEGDTGLALALHGAFDLILLDVMLPGMDGWEILRRLRADQRNKTPVLMLTARDAVADRVRGLDLGSDDYLVKPFDLAELLSRVRALLRRAAREPSPVLDLGEGIAIDTIARRVTRDGDPVELTGKEYTLLEWLARHRGRVVTRETLYAHLFHDEDDSASNLIEVYVCNLRRKLGRAVVELRTPISVILTESQLALKRERSAAEYRESLVICCETAGKMKRLVDDLLLLARSDTRALQATRAACDLSAVADSVRRVLEPLAEERGIRLRHAASPAPTHGDAAQLERILVNLVMNAVQHSPTGAEIVIETASEETHAVARVIDHGRGIPAEALPHIFDRFYRVDPSRARTEGGAGLGLAISQGIAESHGGRIEAQSEPAVRTVFTLRLPSV